MCKGVFRENILEKDENDVINEKNNEKNAILSKSSQFLRKLKEDSFVFSSKECHNTRDFDTGFDKIPSVSFSPSSHRLSTPSHSETKEGHDTTGFDKIPFVSFSPVHILSLLLVIFRLLLVQTIAPLALLLFGHFLLLLNHPLLSTSRVPPVFN
jgi:hypothetical protein